MNVLLLVFASFNIIIWVALGLLLYINLKNKPIFTDTNYYENGVTYPSLSIIIPARNEEESIRQAISQLLEQDYPDLEVIVVNDRSTDHTGSILEEIKIEYPQLKIVTITDLPPKWLGKNHAAYQGMKLATGEWILFTDADVMFSHCSLKKTVSYSLENRLDHLTILPEIIPRGFFYNGFISLFMFAVTYVFLFSKSAGFGAFNLLKRSAYEGIGGYEAIAMKPDDDYSLGKLVVKKGYKQKWGYSKGLISVKFYDNLRAAIKGIEKHQFSGVNYSVFASCASCCFILFIHVYPFIGLFFGPGWAKVLSSISILILLTIYLFSKRYMNVSLKQFLIHPISGLLYFWAIFNSMFKILSRGGIEWRGTIYPLEDLKKFTL